MKAEVLSKSRVNAEDKATRLSLQLKSLRQDISAQGLTRINRNLTEAQHRAKANKVAFLYESMDQNFRELLSEIKGFKAKEPDTYEVYRNKIVDFLAQGIKEKI